VQPALGQVLTDEKDHRVVGRRVAAHDVLEHLALDVRCDRGRDAERRRARGETQDQESHLTSNLTICKIPRILRTSRSVTIGA
jgi:hypothetical protein